MQLKCGVSEKYILGLFILRLFGWLSGVSEILLKELAGSSQWHKRHYIVAILKTDTVYGNHAAKIRWSKHRYHNWQQGMSETNWRLISVEYVDTNFNWNNYASYTDGKMLVEPGIWYIFYTIGVHIVTTTKQSTLLQGLDSFPNLHLCLCILWERQLLHKTSLNVLQGPFY